MKTEIKVNDFYLSEIKVNDFYLSFHILYFILILTFYYAVVTLHSKAKYFNDFFASVNDFYITITVILVLQIYVSSNSLY